MKVLRHRAVLLDSCGSIFILRSNFNQSEDPLWANNLEVGRGLFQ